MIGNDVKRGISYASDENDELCKIKDEYDENAMLMMCDNN